MTLEKRTFAALTSGLEVVEAGGQGLVVSGFSAANHKKAGAGSPASAASGSFGLLALRPEDGQELWRQELQAKPQKHDCNLVDLNEDGVNDCLVVGDGGLLTAVDPTNGNFGALFLYVVVILAHFFCLLL